MKVECSYSIMEQSYGQKKKWKYLRTTSETKKPEQNLNQNLLIQKKVVRFSEGVEPTNDFKINTNDSK